MQHNADHPDQGFEYVMKQQSGPRYWQPKEPVALLTGDLVKATNRHGQDGRSNSGGYLECQVVRLEDDGALLLFTFQSPTN